MDEDTRDTARSDAETFPPGRDLPWSSSTAPRTPQRQQCWVSLWHILRLQELFYPFNRTPVSCSQIAPSTIPEETELQEQMGPRYPHKTRWDKLYQIPSASAMTHCHPTHTATSLLACHPKDPMEPTQVTLVEG